MSWSSSSKSSSSEKPRPPPLPRAGGVPPRDRGGGGSSSSSGSKVGFLLGPSIRKETGSNSSSSAGFEGAFAAGLAGDFSPLFCGVLACFVVGIPSPEVASAARGFVGAGEVGATLGIDFCDGVAASCSPSVAGWGITKRVLHFGHFPSVPASSSLIFRTDPHLSQVYRIVMAASFEEGRTSQGVGITIPQGTSPRIT